MIHLVYSQAQYQKKCPGSITYSKAILALALGGQKGWSLRIHSDWVPRASPSNTTVVKVLILSSWPLFPFWWNLCVSSQNLFSNSITQKAASRNQNLSPIQLKPSGQLRWSQDYMGNLFLACSWESLLSTVPESDPCTKKTTKSPFLSSSSSFFSLDSLMRQILRDCLPGWFQTYCIA